MTRSPGPWVWELDPDWNNNGDEGGIKSVPTGELVCHFGDSTQYYPTSGAPPDEADRALICAAPDLYAALKDIAPDFMPSVDAPCHLGICPQEECRHCCRVARALAAIAKAEGKQ